MLLLPLQSLKTQSFKKLVHYFQYFHFNAHFLLSLDAGTLFSALISQPIVASYIFIMLKSHLVH